MKTSLVTKLLLPAVLAGSIIFMGNTNAIRPEKKEKPSSGKTAVKPASEASVRNASSTDYLRLILPKAMQQSTKQTFTYRKDADGVYRLVVNEGC